MEALSQKTQLVLQDWSIGRAIAWLAKLGIFVLVTFDPLYFIRAFMATIGDTATFIVSLFMLSVFISR